MNSTSRARAAAVCRSWRNFSRLAPPPTGDADCCSIPWILLTDKKLNHSLLQPSTSFSSAKPHRPSSYQLKLKKSKYVPKQENGKFIVASHRQYMMRNRQHSHRGVIHDIFSGEKIKFSPANCCWAIAHFSYLRNLPEANLAAVMEDCQGHTLIHRSWMDDKNWKLAFHEGYLPDIIFHKEQLFCVTSKRGIKAIYLSTPNLPTKWPDPYDKESELLVLDFVRTIVPEMVLKDTKCPQYYLVESYDGMKLWLVTEYCFGDMKVKFEVHQVVEGELVEVVDMGEAMLFLKEGSSLSRCSRLTTLSSTASSNEFFTKNSIYFFHCGKKYISYLGKFTLGDNLATFHPCPIYSDCSPYWIDPVIKV